MPCSEPALPELVNRVGALARRSGRRVATVESCTGGGVAQVLTAVAGSSDWFDRAWVTYSNRAKCEMLDIDSGVILAHGAVSDAVARAMLRGARARMGPQDAVLAITGIAGPGGGSVDKPVGTVYIGWSLESSEAVEHCLFAGDRADVRAAAVRRAIEGLIEHLETAA